MSGWRMDCDGGAGVRWAGIAALTLTLAFGFAWPAAVAQDDETSAAADSAEGSDDDAFSKVEGEIQEWLQYGEGSVFLERGDLNVVQGVSLVAVKMDHKRWSKARSLAFQNAFVQAMGEYVASVRQQTSVSLVRDYFEDDIPESALEYQEGEPPDSFVERIVLKTAVLTEHELDRKLAESGMSEDEIQSLTTPVQKRTALAESIKKETVTTAVGSAAGLVPVQTFEEFDDEDNSAIGVVAVYSERMRHIANKISRGEAIRPDSGRARDSIADRIASYATDELPSEFGVRLWWDEQGYPAVVSFGQWGWSSANLSNRKRANRRKSARKQAESDALSNLTVFIQASTRFTDESIVGADLEEAFNLPRGGVPEEIEAVEITDRLVETARIKAKVALTGYTNVRPWSAPHPDLDEHEIVGMVAYWSPAREDRIRKTIGEEAKHAPPEPESRERKNESVPDGRRGREPDLADF